MRKMALFALALLAFTQFALSAEFSGTYTEAKAEAARLGRPLLVDYFAEW